MKLNSRIWLARTGEGGYALTDCVKRGVVALRYHTVGDARTLTVDEIATALAEAKTRVALVPVARMLYEFVHSVHPGDVVVTPHAASRTVYFGEVTGPYEWSDPAPVADLFHFRRVAWWGFLDRDTDFEADRLKDIDRPPTFYELTDRSWWLERAQAAHAASEVVRPPPKSPRPDTPSAGGGPGKRHPGVRTSICKVCGLDKSTSIIEEGICADCR